MGSTMKTSQMQYKSVISKVLLTLCAVTGLFTLAPVSAQRVMLAGPSPLAVVMVVDGAQQLMAQDGVAAGDQAGVVGITVQATATPMPLVSMRRQWFMQVHQ